MTDSLTPFEADLLAVLDISDSFTRSVAVEYLVKEQPRDEHGRFASTGPKTETTGPGRGGRRSSRSGRGERAGGQPVTSQQAREALLQSMDVTVAPDQVDGLMRDLAGGPPVNLEHLQVSGPGNEHLFAEHATETPRSEMPQLPETVEGLRAFRSEERRGG